MKAITVEPKKPGTARWEDVPEPDPLNGSVVVEAVAVGVCGPDVEIIEGKYGWAPSGRHRGGGIGSDITWQIQAYGGYRFTELFQVMAGYRALGVDYQKGADKERFLYDVTTFGPVLQIGFNL